MSSHQRPPTIRLPQPSGQDVTAMNELPSRNLIESTDERTMTLGRLLRASHNKAAPLREPQLILHSHMPHILGSAYYLGAPAAQLDSTFEAVLETLVNTQDDRFIHGPVIDKKDFRKFMLKKEYSVAFVDFFDHEFEEKGDWKAVVAEYLFGGSEPMASGLIGGLGHPAIHLAYAFEYESSEIAAEGMSLLCTDYFPATELLDEPQADTSTYKTRSLADVFEAIRLDKRLDGVIEHPGIANMELILEKHLKVVLEHWNAWEVYDTVEQLEHICDVSVLLAISTGNATDSYDFFLIHMMTVAHAYRLLWHHIPSRQHKHTLKAYSMLAILIYIGQRRPPLDMSKVEVVETKGRDWDWVRKTALDHPAKYDVHFFKVVRAPMVFADVYGEKEDFYLRASLKYLDEFAGFEGFGPVGEDGFDGRKEGWRPADRAID